MYNIKSQAKNSWFTLVETVEEYGFIPTDNGINDSYARYFLNIKTLRVY